MEKEKDSGYRATCIVLPPDYIDPLRAEFAKAAMQGIMANSYFQTKIFIDRAFADRVAEWAVTLADALTQRLRKS